MKSSIGSVFSLLALICMTVAAGCGSGGNGGGQLTATHFSVSAPASATVGSAISVTVIALDASNMTATTYVGEVHFTSTDPRAVLPSDSSLPNGTGTFSVTFMTAGNQTITVTDRVKGSIVGTSSSISAASQTTHFSVTAPSSASVGASFNVTVSALDSSNHAVTTYAGTFQFTSTDPSAVLPGPSMLTSGMGTFTATLNTAGNQTVTATDTLTVSIKGTSGSIAVTSGCGVNPVPLINQPLSPDAVTPGGPSLTLTVNGTGFVAGSVVHWNGSARKTTFLSESTLTANIRAADVASFNTAAVTVLSPAPGEMHHRAQLMLIERQLGIVPHLTRVFQERMAQMRANSKTPEDPCPTSSKKATGTENRRHIAQRISVKIGHKERKLTRFAKSYKNRRKLVNVACAVIQH